MINHQLKFQKPLVFLDIEATGLDPLFDRIVELALIKIKLDGSRDTY